VPVDLLTSGTSYTALSSWLIVDAWGAGAGGNQQASADGGGGGGGGAFASSVDTALTVGSSYSYAIGQGGSGGINATPATNGGDTTWRTTVVVAKGGSLGSPGAGTAPGNGGAGGLSSASTGTRAAYNGGWGEHGLNSSAGRGGPGGSSGGRFAVGYRTGATAYAAATYDTAQTPLGGGHGGNGANSNSANGSAPASGYGGGGGGASEGTTVTGGGGANGKIEVYYSPPQFLLCLGCG
jgi:hypothetical protein